ncbi:MAG: Zn-ribbon domain-containing OB-fold protein [Candidatus Binatia bacterium]
MTEQQSWRLLPTIEGETRRYWEAAARHQLLIQRCRSCQSYQFYPRGFCGECYSLDMEWVPSSGKGTVWTFTVTRQNRDRSFREMVPYVLAYVELEEGVKMMTNIVECKPEEVFIGMPVEVTFEDVTREVSIPKFRPRRE